MFTRIDLKRIRRLAGSSGMPWSKTDSKLTKAGVATVTQKRGKKTTRLCAEKILRSGSIRPEFVQALKDVDSKEVQTVRSLAILRWIHSEGWPNQDDIKAIAETFGVSERTIYRDLELIDKSANTYASLSNDM